MEQLPSISSWFADRHVLVTGGTGFLGKALISKLLLSCPAVANIYILIREKKNVDSKARLQLLLQQEPFRVLREKYPERLKKLIVINGDTTVDGLNLSSESRDLLINNVSTIFHMAASVRFDLTVKDAVNMNTRGTLNVLNLAKQIKNLVSLIHVSTAYCQCGETVLEERAYPTEVSAEKIFALVDSTDDQTLKAMTRQLLGDQPNTYAFSKALTEDLISRCNDLPIGVARPSIVSASWKEPVAGWVDNVNGPTGLMIGAAKGVIRTMLCNPDYLADVIPCDMTVNTIIAFACQIGLKRPDKVAFMNVTESGHNPISWGAALNLGRQHARNYPFSGPLWYPGGDFTNSKIVYSICVLLFHLVPAYLLDCLIFLTGNKPFLVRIQARISVGLELLQYYTTKRWVFKNDAMRQLENRLSDRDKDVFFMNTQAIDWNDYMLKYILGTRKYCLKEDESTLPKARRVHSILYVVDLFVRLLFCLLFVYVVYSWTLSFRTNTMVHYD